MERSEGRGASTSSGSPTFFLGGGIFGLWLSGFLFFLGFGFWSWVEGFGLGFRVLLLGVSF